MAKPETLGFDPLVWQGEKQFFYPSESTDLIVSTTHLVCFVEDEFNVPIALSAFRDKIGVLA